MRRVHSFVAFVLLAALIERAGADERRTFAVTVDGKKAGTYAVDYAPRTGGMRLSAKAAIDVRIYLIRCKYSLTATQTFVGTTPTAIDSRVDDDGTKCRVTYASGAAAHVNDKTTALPADVLLATAWYMPAADSLRSRTLFDLDDGSLTAVDCAPQGKRSIGAAGKRIESVGYKVTGKGVNAEWWFDDAGRAVAQEVEWDGHKVRLALAEISEISR